jgi:hypothetical protein
MTLKLKPATVTTLREIAGRKGLTMSQVVDDALAQFAILSQ